jgi:beta-glucanase (GH16 family)
MSEFHTYKLVWTAEKLDWMIDGTVVRTLNYADAKGGKEYPQTPMQVKLGTWVAGKKDAPEGTVTWSGGVANFENGPSQAFYKRIVITDYAGGVEGAKSYVYGDTSGTYNSIVVDTEGGGLEEKEEEDSKSSTSSNSTAAVSKPSKTSSGVATKTEASGSGAAANSFAVASFALAGAALLLNAL